MISGLELLSLPEDRRSGRGYEKLKRKVKKRLDKGLDCIILVEGERGYGKSSMCFSMAYDLDPKWREDPKFATKYLTIYSALEFTILVNYLLNYGKEAEEFYRRRFIVFEEVGVGASSFLASSAAVQELAHQLDVLRQFQINLIMNTPLADEVQQLKFRYAHFLIFCTHRDDSRRKVYGTWKIRVRTEDKITFVNPVLAERKIVDPKFPGMRIVVPYCPEHIWELYQHEKKRFMKDVNTQGLKRIMRLKRVRSDLITANLRPQFVNLLDRDMEVKPEFLESWESITENTAVTLTLEDKQKLLQVHKAKQRRLTAEKKRKIIELRKQGFSYHSIAKMVGCSTATAMHVCNEALQDIKDFREVDENE